LRAPWLHTSLRCPNNRVGAQSCRDGNRADYTGRLYADLRPGIEARVVGPFGTFDYRLGLVRQIWIAAGIGITPFISWIRARDESFDYDADFYYSVASETGAIFVDEIKAATGKYPSLNLYLVRTDRDPQLSPQHIYTRRPLAQRSIYMCGPPGMMRAFEKEFHKHGAALNQIRWEPFGLQ
jgi:predicted ferric reductase